MSYKIQRTDIDQLKEQRLEYLNSLPEFQDIFIEFMIPDAKCYVINNSNDIAGYSILDFENSLIEFFVYSKYSGDRNTIFDQVLQQLSVRKIYCKSFDYVLMKSCLERKFNYKTIGLLYRNLDKGGTYTDTNLRVRFADQDDVAFLSAQNDEVFEPVELLPQFINDKSILIYSRSDAIVGCGFLTRIHPDFNYFDIGVWTSPEHRKQGFATHIINHLKFTCLEDGNIPICGCAYGNISSQKTLEKCGFKSRHKLIEFTE